MHFYRYVLVRLWREIPHCEEWVEGNSASGPDSATVLKSTSAQDGALVVIVLSFPPGAWGREINQAGI